MAFGVEATGGNSGESSNRTLAFTVTAANLLLVGVGVGISGGDIASGVTGVTFNGVAMTAIPSSDATDSNWAACRWYRLFSPAAGTFNIVASTVAANQSSVHAISFTDADIAGTPLGTPSTTTNTTANPTLTVVDSASSDIVVSLNVNDNATGATAAAGTTIHDAEDVGTDTDHCSQYQTASGGNTVASWTNSGSGDGWAASGVAVKGVGGGGGGTYNAVPQLDHYYRMISG
jgi:hypothetical protein